MQRKSQESQESVGRAARKRGMIMWKGKLRVKPEENVETKRRADKVPDEERKWCQEEKKKKKEERVGKTSERKLLRKELQTERAEYRGKTQETGAGRNQREGVKERE